MPRQRVRKTTRGQNDISLYKNAYVEVKSGKSLRSAAEMYGVNYVSLLRYVKKRDQAEGEKAENVNMGYVAPNKVFSEEQERELSKYLIRCADIYFGLSTKEVRKLAFELTVKYNIKKPNTWVENEMAGEEWFRSFMRRNPELSVRAAQATSLSRATSFNKTNVDAFYDNLTIVMNRQQFEPQNIFNVDETGITTVQKPNRIIARRGSRQVGALTSAERGTLVTLAFAANALGNVIPPLFVFPRVRYQDHFIRDGPVGSVGAGNPSGWMQEETFILFLKHFQKHSNASVSNKVLLVLDNHSSHIHINALDFCKLNGIVLLSFPPHCSHKLQPLDRSVFGPLKKAINTACDAWMRNHPGKTMTIYDIPGIVTTAMPLAMTPSNIQAGFRNTGIYPYNRSLFQEIDFAPSFVTDRPNPNVVSSEANIAEQTISDLQQNLPTHTNSASSIEPLLTTPPKTVQQLPSPVPSTSTNFSPEEVRPFPKAPPRKTSNRGRKTRKSAIYTDTPEKEAIRNEYEEKERRMKAKQVTKKIAQRPIEKKATRNKKKSDTPPTSSDDEECYCLVCVAPFSESRPKESWIQCRSCRRWAHERCTDGSLYYTCNNCESD